MMGMLVLMFVIFFVLGLPVFFGMLRVLGGILGILFSGFTLMIFMGVCIYLMFIPMGMWVMGAVTVLFIIHITNNKPKDRLRYWRYSRPVY